jgi:uncharacterized protein
MTDDGARALHEQVEFLYTGAKAGGWDAVWASLVGEQVLAAACSRYVKPRSGWTFLHQAAYAGNEAAVRLLVRLGASLSLKSKDGESPVDVARKHGHAALAELMHGAEQNSKALWAPPPEPELLPSSHHWSAHVERRAWRELRVGYGGGCVVIPAGARFYVDSFERVLVGWHGTYDPPSGMDGESML